MPMTKGLKRKLFFFRILSAVLLVLCLFLGTVLCLQTAGGQSLLRIMRRKEQPPALFEVKKLLFSLVYSGVEDMEKPEVRLGVDFAQKVWTLSNLHRFDENNHVILEQNRYGLCGAQADYVYRKILPLIGPAYQIEFVRTLETKYFFDPTASIHYVLRITNRNAPEKQYLIDTVFNRYGPGEEFDNYVFQESTDHLKFSPDVIFDVGSRIPLLIKNDYILSLSLVELGGRFDPNHLLFTLDAFGKHKLQGRPIFSIRFLEGKMEFYEDKKLAKKILSAAEFKRIKNIILTLFYGMIPVVIPDAGGTAV